MERIKTLDIAKGILIIFVIFHHSLIRIQSNSIYIDILNFLQIPFFVTYFMPCFIIISGILYKSNISFYDLIKKNISSLLLPAIVFTIVNNFICTGFKIDVSIVKHIITSVSDAWFLVCLFWNRIFLYLLLKTLRLERSKTLIVLSIVCLIGVFLNEHILTNNYWYYKHALISTLFFAIGYYYKDKFIYSNNTIFCIILYISIFSICLSYSSIPTFTATINIKIQNWFYFLFLSILGSKILIQASSKIKSNQIEYIGKNSIYFYLLHYIILRFIEDPIKSLTNEPALIFILYFSITTILCYIVIKNIIRLRTYFN